jgi:hypothetical protein
MKQELEDVPATQREAERRKGPIPPSAIFLAIGLVAVLILFFGPAIIEFGTPQ